MTRKKNWYLLVLILCMILVMPMSAQAKSKKKKEKWTFKPTVTTNRLVAGETWVVNYDKTQGIRYSFKSSKKSVVSVTKSGVIRARKKGKATLTITGKKKVGKKWQKKTRKVKLTVYNPILKTTKKDKKAVSAVTIMQGESYRPIVTGFSYINRRQVNWYSSNTNVASVSGNGTVTGMRAGDAVITMQISGQTTRSYNVHVDTEYLEDGATTVLVNVIGSYRTVKLDDLFPSGATGATWYDVYDPSIVTVSNGIVSARANGVTTVIGHKGRYTKKFIVKSIAWDAHRGYLDVRPENSIDAFVQAGLAGAAGIEADVRFTKDGVPVMFHDRDLRAMTDVETALPELNGKAAYVDRLTYAQIQKIRINNGNGVALAKDLRIPTFRQYLDVCRQYGCLAVIELKNSKEKQWPAVYEKDGKTVLYKAGTAESWRVHCQTIYKTIQDAGMLSRSFITSFSGPTLSAFRDLTESQGLYHIPIGSLDSTAYKVIQGRINASTSQNSVFGGHMTSDYNPILGRLGKAWETFR